MVKWQGGRIVIQKSKYSMAKYTSYGKKRTRAGRFVIVVPHGAGDDLKSGVIGVRLAKALKGSYIINNQYKKLKNRQIKNPDLVEDFNHLKWSFVKKRFLWKSKKPAMKEFYLDIAQICDRIKENTGEKAVVVYIHSMQNDKVGLDLGTGLRPQGSRLFGSGYHIKTGFNTGEVTTKINQAKKLLREFKRELKRDFNLGVTAGESFSGWSKWSGIQFHKHQGRNDYAVQIEVNEFLRSNETMINYTVELIARSLERVFMK